MSGKNGLRIALVLAALARTHAAFAQDTLPPKQPAQGAQPAPGEKKPDVIIEYVPVQVEGQTPAQSQPAPAPAPPPRPPTDAEEGAKTRLALRFDGGFQYEQIDKVPVTAARFRLGVGGQTDSNANYASISILYGATTNGLRTYDFKVGWIGDLYRYSIMSFGVDAEIGYLWVHRATIDDRMWALGATAAAHIGFDLYPFGPRNDHAITAQARIDGSFYFGGAAVWGPELLLGFRY